jgi:hypothetical protein
MGSTKIAAPTPRDYGDEMYQGLRAQSEAMSGTGRFADIGSLADIESAQRPKWEAMELRTLGNMLGGVGGERGLMDIYSQDIVPTLSATEAGSDRYRRMQDIADVGSMGQSATTAFLEADPLKKQASDLLLGGAIDEYKLGATLDPSLRRESQQLYRQAATARGIAQSPFSAAEEAYWGGLQAQQLKQQRQSALSQLLGQRQSLVGDPFMQVLGRQGQAFGAAPGYGGMGQQMGQALGPRIFSPESQMQQDISMSNQQTALAVSQANQQASNAMKTGLMSMGGSILGGWACHVAREVYGAENPKWVEFFVWKETKGPRWFRALYNRYSEQAARFIRNRPGLKDIIRTWMDGKIKEA